MMNKIPFSQYCLLVNSNMVKYFFAINLLDSSSESDTGAEESELGTQSNTTPSSVEEIEPVGRTTSSNVSARMVLANAGHTLSGTEAELVLNPLRLAFETKNTKVVELALDCLHVCCHFLHNCRLT